MSTVTMEVKNIPLSEIDADDEFNCRGEISAIDVVDLVRDIEENGLLQPVSVMFYTEKEAHQRGKKYKLLAGYRRFNAHKVLRRETIEAIIKPHMEEASARLFNLSENLVRCDLTITQEAKAVNKLRLLGVKEETIAQRLSKSRGWVQVRMMLLKLPDDIQTEVALGNITQPEIRQLYSIMRATDNPDSLYKAVRAIKEAKARGRKAVIEDKTKKLTRKKQRSAAEMLAMIDHIMDSRIPAGLHTKTLAWAAGEITNLDLYLAIKKFAVDKGIDYDIPTE